MLYNKEDIFKLEENSFELGKNYRVVSFIRVVDEQESAR